MSERETNRLASLEEMQGVLLEKITGLLIREHGADRLQIVTDTLLSDAAPPTRGGTEVETLVRQWRALEAEARPLREPGLYGSKGATS